MKIQLLAITFGAMLFTLCVPAAAQQPKKIPRVGFLLSPSSSADRERVEAFRQGLRQLGYAEGQNVFVEYRYAGGNADEYPKLAAALVSFKVDLIVVGGGSSLARAAKETTNRR